LESECNALVLRSNANSDRSGSGDNYIHKYSSQTGKWQPIGRYIQGNDNNAYINGLDYCNGRLYTSWTVRETPNADTNHDVFFAYSDDLGWTWLNTKGIELKLPISTIDPATMIRRVPENSRMVNQEGQLVDAKGQVHILMRDNLSGNHLYHHYFRHQNGKPLPSTYPHPPYSLNHRRLGMERYQPWRP
jgi:hypothetical protein